MLCAVWFELIYFAPTVLTEMFAAHVALIALYAADYVVVRLLGAL